MQNEKQCSLDFAAAGCNRKPGSLCALPAQKIAAYAACSNVLIVINAGRRVSAAIPVHKAPVTSVVLVEAADEVFLISSSSDGYIAIWRCAIPKAIEKRPWTEWERCQHWKAHDTTVVTADAFWSKSRSSLVIASAGLDSAIRVWVRNAENAFECSSECCILDHKGASSALPECLEICSDLDGDGGNGLLIAVGGTHQYLQLFITDEKLKNLRQACGIAGHRDWIRGVAFSPRSSSPSVGDKRYIATASKDSTVRIWSIAKTVSNDGKENATENDEVNLFSDLGPTKAFFSLCNTEWEVAAVALLHEHGGAVHSVCFEQRGQKDNGSVPRIVTSSMDCSIAIWQFSQDDGWQCATRFGLMGGAGAHALGFFGAVFASEGCSDVLAHNFGGAVHCWRGTSSELSTHNLSSTFVADCAPGGHSGPVHDLDWDPKGLFFLTCSQDKSARIFLENRSESERGFAEWARPQVHGHAIHTAAFCDKAGVKYVSGAEESMLRLFEAPAIFMEPGTLGMRKFDAESRAVTASVPELGLSNKAVYLNEPASVGADEIDENAQIDEADQKNAGDLVVSFGAGRSAAAFPLEEELKQSRLWPETAKLYGHGNTISCVAVCIDRGVLASACYAQKFNDASIRLWDLCTGAEAAQLPAHDLTVTRMNFSQDGKALLSVSRDRSFAIHFCGGKGKYAYGLVHRQKTAHARLLYDGTWLFNRDFVVTCGRDKRLRFFSTRNVFEESQEICQGDPPERCREIMCTKYSSGVSAVDAFRFDAESICHLAIGFEDGSIRVFRASREKSGADFKVKEIATIPQFLQCSARIARLRWRPMANTNSESNSKLQLAIGSADHSVRILSLQLPPPVANRS